MVLAQAAEVPQIAWSSFAPEIVVAGGALALMLIVVAGSRQLAAAISIGVGVVALGVWLFTQELWVPGGITVGLAGLSVAASVGLAPRPQLVRAWMAELIVLAALGLTIWQWNDLLAPAIDAAGQGERLGTDLNGSVALDGIAFFTRLTVYVSLALVLPIGYSYLKERGINRRDFEPLVLLAAVGMALLGAASDLITLFIAIELLSLALYVLAGIARRDRRSQEAGIKYFLIGAVASTVLLYGLALIYMATGTVEIGELAGSLALVTTPRRVAIVGVALVTVGLGFKVALVPFHLWTPDVYQGAPTNVTAFMAAATKAAGFAAVLRLFLVAFGRLEDLWVPVLAVVAAATMMLGAVLAIIQRDVKRVLAYSSVTHAGYAAIGVAAGGAAGLSATLWYLLTYAVTVIGAFGVVIALERRRRGEVALVDLRGLGKQSPALAALFSLALLSLAGIPGTAGFMGKWLVFSAAAESELVWLVVVAVVSSVVAAFFYLRLMATMFLEEPDEGVEQPVVSTGLALGLNLSAAAVLVLGIYPAGLLDIVERAQVIAL